jgi:anti-sigma factor RsiW
VSCESFDWKAYALGEMSPAERRQAESHAAACAACREEAGGLRVTLDAMSTLREEEVPRRIAFVSDKVFERRWWQQLLNPTFAAACVVAAAILVHGFWNPSNRALQQAQIDAAVAKAVAASETRQRAETMAAFDIIDKQYKQMYIATAGMVRQ